MSKARKKIGLIGGGNIGGTLAHLITLQSLGDVVILDRTSDFAKGKALDLEQALAAMGEDCKVIGTDNYAELTGSDVIIITAGIPRGPGMSRDDLLTINQQVMDTAAAGVKQYCPNAFIIVVTNPLDAMVYAFWKASGLHHNKIVGMGGVLDSSRFKLFLSQELNVSVKEIHTCVLGGHGDTMVPLIKYTNIAGIPLTEIIKMGLLSREKLDSIVQRTRDGGAEIVKLLQKGSAYYAPAVSAIEMAISYLLDQKRILSCAVYLEGQYGVRDLYMGVPAIIGANGIEKIVEFDLDTDERAMLNRSVEAVQSLIASLK